MRRNNDKNASQREHMQKLNFIIK